MERNIDLVLVNKRNNNVIAEGTRCQLCDLGTKLAKSETFSIIDVNYGERMLLTQNKTKRL